MKHRLKTYRNKSQPHEGEDIWHIRRPDHEEEKTGLILQIWGDEGYWHIVDAETQELVKAVSEPVTTKALLSSHPEWAGKSQLVVENLKSIQKGLLHRSPTPSRIENITINLTTNCNLCCTSCYLPGRDPNVQKLDPNKAIEFLAKLKPYLSPAANITLLGGEPFLYPDGVLAVAEWANKNKFTCSVSTNGTIPLKAIAPRMRSIGLQVQVSIDGASAQTNDAIRGAGTFEKALNSARDLIASHVYTTLCMVACQENEAEIGAYLQLAKSLRANEARIIPLKRLGNAMNGGLKPVSQLSMIKVMAAELKREPDLEKLCKSDLFSILKAMVREGSRRESCGSGTQTLLLQADGSIYPCINSTLPHTKLGATEDDISIVLQNGLKWGSFLSVTSPKHPCSPCAVKRWCLGGCPGETMQRGGALNKHWNCTDLRNAITYIMWQSSNGGAVTRAERTKL